MAEGTRLFDLRVDWKLKEEEFFQYNLPQTEISAEIFQQFFAKKRELQNKRYELEIVNKKFNQIRDQREKDQKEWTTLVIKGSDSEKCSQARKAYETSNGQYYVIFSQREKLQKAILGLNTEIAALFQHIRGQNQYRDQPSLSR